MQTRGTVQRINGDFTANGVPLLEGDVLIVGDVIQGSVFNSSGDLLVISTIAGDRIELRGSEALEATLDGFEEVEPETAAGEEVITSSAKAAIFEEHTTRDLNIRAELHDISTEKDEDGTRMGEAELGGTYAGVDPTGQRPLSDDVTGGTDDNDALVIEPELVVNFPEELEQGEEQIPLPEPEQGEEQIPLPEPEQGEEQIPLLEPEQGEEQIPLLEPEPKSKPEPRGNNGKHNGNDQEDQHDFAHKDPTLEPEVDGYVDEVMGV